jgi:hypothetical protein
VRTLGDHASVACGHPQGKCAAVPLTHPLEVQVVTICCSVSLQQGGDARLLAVFGQDYVGRPQKLAMLFDSAEEKTLLYQLLDSK